MCSYRRHFVPAYIPTSLIFSVRQRSVNVALTRSVDRTRRPLPSTVPRIRVSTPGGGTAPAVDQKNTRSQCLPPTKVSFYQRLLTASASARDASHRWLCLPDITRVDASPSKVRGMQPARSSDNRRVRKQPHVAHRRWPHLDSNQRTTFTFMCGRFSRVVTSVCEYLRCAASSRKAYGNGLLRESHHTYHRRPASPHEHLA